MGRPSILLLAALALVAPSLAPAQSQVCSGLLPMAVIPASPGGFTTGCFESTLKAPGGSGAAGNYARLDFPLCDAGTCAGIPPNTSVGLRCVMANGYDCCVQVGEVLTSEPGNASGPLLQGLQGRWDQDTDQRPGICFTDYVGNGQRVLSVPITTPVGNGRTDVTVLGFAVAFLFLRPSITTAASVTVLFQPTGVVASHAPTWGHVRTIYR